MKSIKYKVVINTHPIDVHSGSLRDSNHPTAPSLRSRPPLPSAFFQPALCVAPFSPGGQRPAGARPPQASARDPGAHRAGELPAVPAEGGGAGGGAGGDSGRAQPQQRAGQDPERRPWLQVGAESLVKFKPVSHCNRTPLANRKGFE